MANPHRGLAGELNDAVYDSPVTMSGCWEKRAGRSSSARRSGWEGFGGSTGGGGTYAEAQAACAWRSRRSWHDVRDRDTHLERIHLARSSSRCEELGAACNKLTSNQGRWAPPSAVQCALLRASICARLTLITTGVAGGSCRERARTDLWVTLYPGNGLDQAVPGLTRLYQVKPPLGSICDIIELWETTPAPP